MPTAMSENFAVVAKRSDSGDFFESLSDMPFDDGCRIMEMVCFSSEKFLYLSYLF